MKDLLGLIFSLFLSLHLFGQASISGKVIDVDTGEPILFGDIVVYQDGKLITGEQTDFDGNYIISPIDTGVYDVRFLYVGYEEVMIEKVQVFTDKETVFINTSMKSGVALDFPVIRNCGGPALIEQDNFDKGQTFTSKDIRRMPNKN